MTRYGGFHQPGHSGHPAKKPRLYQEEEPRSQVRKMMIIMVLLMMVMVMVVMTNIVMIRWTKPLLPDTSSHLPLLEASSSSSSNNHNGTLTATSDQIFSRWSRWCWWCLWCCWCLWCWWCCCWYSRDDQGDAGDAVGAKQGLITTVITKSMLNCCWWQSQSGRAERTNLEQNKHW